MAPGWLHGSRLASWPQAAWLHAAMLQAARELGATHIVVVDADEIFTANALTDGKLREKVLLLDPGEVMWVSWIYPWKSLDYFRLDEWYQAKYQAH